MADNESKTPADQDAFTVVELISRMTRAIFSEVDTIQGGNFTPRQPAISGLRRNLQRSYLQQLSVIVLQRSDFPDDAATVASAELAALRTSLVALLAGNVELDGYSKAHLQDTANRIEKILDARFTLKI